MSVTFEIEPVVTGYLTSCPFAPQRVDKYTTIVETGPEHAKHCPGPAITARWPGEHVFDHADRLWDLEMRLQPMLDLDTCCTAGVTAVPVCDTDDLPSLNMSNTNARKILDVLGFVSDELCGSVSAVEFAGRVLTAVALNPSDPGVPATVESGAGATIVHAGRRVGYVDERLASLRDLADHAIRMERNVNWA